MKSLLFAMAAVALLSPNLLPAQSYRSKLVRFEVQRGGACGGAGIETPPAEIFPYNGAPPAPE